MSFDGGRERVLQQKEKLSLLSLFVLICFTATGLGDHCPEERQARGKAEISLAGVAFGRGRFPEVLKRYGQPDSGREYTNATYPEGSGEATYLWKIGDGQLEINTMFYHRQNSRIESVTAIRVEGDSDVPGWQTGRGLGLGDGFNKVIQLYGSVFLEGTAIELRTASHKVTLCFSNETRLGVELNNDNNITAIQLVLSIE